MSIDDEYSDYITEFYESQYEELYTEEEFYELWLKDNLNRKKMNFWQHLQIELECYIDPDDLPF